MLKILPFSKIISNIILVAHRKWNTSATIRNVSKVYVGDIISKIFGVAVVLILIRCMTQEGYAAYVVFSALATLFVSVVGNGINVALVRFSTEYFFSSGVKPYALYALAIIVQIILFVIIILFVLAFPVKTAFLFFGKSEYAYLLPVSLLLGLASILISVGRSILQAEERFNFYILTLWLRQGLVFLLVVGLWIFHFLNFQSVAWGTALIQLTVGVGILIYAADGLRSLDWLRKSCQEKLLIRKFSSASGWLIAYFTVIAIFGRMDILILTRLANTTEIASYGVAFQYYSLGLLLLGSVSAVLVPKFSHVEMQDPIRQQSFMRKWLRSSLWIGIPVVIFILFGKPLFILLNGARYAEAFNILEILSVGVWLSLMLSPLTNILMSRKEFRLLFILATIAFIGGTVVLYFGVQNWGAVGAAIAVVLTHNIFLQLPILWKVSLRNA